MTTCANPLGHHSPSIRSASRHWSAATIRASRPSRRGRHCLVFLALGPDWRNDKIESVVLIATDISDRKAAESQMQQSEAKWRSLVENAPDLIISDRRRWNDPLHQSESPGFETTVGRTVYEYIDKEYWEIARAAHEAVCKTGQPQQYEVHVHGPAGPAWFAHAWAPFGTMAKSSRSSESPPTLPTAKSPKSSSLASEKSSAPPGRPSRTAATTRRVRPSRRACPVFDRRNHAFGGICRGKIRSFLQIKSDYERGVSLLRDALFRGAPLDQRIAPADPRRTRSRCIVGIPDQRSQARHSGIGIRKSQLFRASGGSTRSRHIPDHPGSSFQYPFAQRRQAPRGVNATWPMGSVADSRLGLWF